MGEKQVTNLNTTVTPRSNNKKVWEVLFKRGA